MTLNYPVYDRRTGARLSFGPPTGAYGGTYGWPIFTTAEFHHVLAWIKSKGFDVYANSKYGGVNLSAHSPKSWHYVNDQYGNSLAADVGTYGDVNERSRLLNEVIPGLNKIGMGYHYAQFGYVPAHDNHLHVDVSNWGRRGGGEGYGYFETYRKANPFTALVIPGAVSKRKPKSCVAYAGMKGNYVKVVQQIAGTTADGEYGPKTVAAVKALQKSLGLVQDGSFGPNTARAYLNRVGTRRKGSTGYSVKLIQYLAGLTMDGSFGPNTEHAVREMQAWAGLTPDGVFGAGCRSKLLY